MTTRLDDVHHHPVDSSARPRAAQAATLAATAAMVLVAVTATLIDLRAVAIVGLTVGTALLACAVVVDVIHFRLPNALVAAAGLIGMVTAAVEARPVEAVAAACIASAPLLLMHLADQRAIGFGDVKFAAAAGALVGAVSAPAALLVPLIALVIAGIARLVAPHGARPLGPALFGGFVTALLAAAMLASTGWMS